MMKYLHRVNQLLQQRKFLNNIILKRHKISLVDVLGLEKFDRQLRDLPDTRRKALDQVLNMPKEEKHLKELRQQRRVKRQRQKQTLTASPNVLWQVVGNGAATGARALLLYSDHNRYLFNCGEGTQRIMQAQCPSRALAQLTNVFFTSRTWERMGGFPGLCLTTRAHGSPDITVHGPERCSEIFQHVQNFITLFDFDVITHPSTKDYEDANIMVKHLLVKKTEPSTTSNRHNSSWNMPDAPDVVYEPVDQSAMAYLVTIHSKKGKLNMNKCIELKIPPGPLLGELKAGREIILEDQRVVKPEDVLEPEAIPVVCGIVDAPTESHIEALVRNDSFKTVDNLKVMFHFTSSELIQNEQYQNWMKNELNDGIEHIFINDEHYGFSSEKVVKFVNTLNTVSPKNFPKLMDQTNLKTDEAIVQSGLRFNVRPKFGLDFEIVDQIDKPVDLDEFFNKVEEENNYDKGLLSKICQDSNSKMKENSDQPEYPKVIFLGTGSSVPSKYRNVSSILVETAKDKFMLLDCGEGTLLQLHRMYGRIGAENVLRKLKAVYVSHLHADHHLGLINILLARKKVTKERMNVISTSIIIPFLTAYHSSFEPILDDIYLIRNEHLCVFSLKEEFPAPLLYLDLMDCLCKNLGLKNIYTGRALHCPHAFSLAFATAETDFKVVYTGDTRPHKLLLKLGKRLKSPDLLIHEATLEHEMLSDAIQKNHSTFTEAIKDGEDMAAKFTILTHFSQRYTKMSRVDEFRDKPNVGVAFDFLAVNPRNFHFVREMYLALEKIYNQDLLLLDNRTYRMGGKHMFAGEEGDHIFEIDFATGPKKMKIN